MSELIDREATVKQICKMGEMLGMGHDRDVTIAVALFVQDDKSAFPTVDRPHGEWVSVEERLPEEDGDYLATYVFCNEVVTDKVRYTTRLGFYYDTVIAWMPLPEPYKREGEKE